MCKSTVATCHGDPSLTKWGPTGDPIFSEMGTLNRENGDLGTEMGTQKAERGPHGDQVPQMGTHVVTVVNHPTSYL